jgi:hypothetical protein
MKVEFDGPFFWLLMISLLRVVEFEADLIWSEVETYQIDLRNEFYR